MAHILTVAGHANELGNMAVWPTLTNSPNQDLETQRTCDVGCMADLPNVGNIELFPMLISVCSQSTHIWNAGRIPMDFDRADNVTMPTIRLEQ